MLFYVVRELAREVQCCHQLAVKLHELQAMVFAAAVDCALCHGVEGNVQRTARPRSGQRALYGRALRRVCENYLAACKALADSLRNAPAH